MRATTAPLHTLAGAETGGTRPLAGLQESTGPLQDSGPLLDSRPLLDHAVLDKLCADLDDYEEVWQVFVRNFVAALPLRIDRLRLALTTGDLPGAIDAVLSLKSASLQVGAERLAAHARDLELAVREGIRDRDPSGVLPWLAADHLPQIRQRAGQTSYILEAHLKKASDAVPGNRSLAGHSRGLVVGRYEDAALTDGEDVLFHGCNQGLLLDEEQHDAGEQASHHC